MKNLLFFLVIFLMGVTAIQAQNPIPSYNFPVNQRANFQETQGPTRAKKKVNVAVQCTSTKTLACSATIWVYSLDFQTVYGPFTVYGGGVLSLDVDEGEWGVYIESEDHVLVDVWIE
jgi:hypothetical protein